MQSPLNAVHMTEMPQPHAPMQAALSVIAAMALIGYVDGLVAEIAQHVGLWQFHLMRALMALPLIALIGAAMGWQVWPRRPWAVGLRGAFLAVSMAFYFGALGFLSVAEAVAGLFTAPLFMLLITTLWFREPVRAATVLAVLIGLTGSLIVLRPDASGAGWAGLMPIAGAAFYALAAVSTRRVCAGEGAFALLGGFFAASLLLSACGLALAGGDGFLTRGWVAPSGAALWLTAVQAVASVIGVGLITRGYILADAPQVAVFEYSLLIFAAAWGWLLWGQTVDAGSGVGLALILCSGGLLFRAERQRVAL